jgi:hypothetical protein
LPVDERDDPRRESATDPIIRANVSYFVAPAV